MCVWFDSYLALLQTDTSQNAPTTIFVAFDQVWMVCIIWFVSFSNSDANFAYHDARKSILSDINTDVRATKYMLNQSVADPKAIKQKNNASIQKLEDK
jgi:hypothetical protein